MIWTCGESKRNRGKHDPAWTIGGGKITRKVRKTVAGQCKGMDRVELE